MPAPSAERALLWSTTWRGPCLACIQQVFTVCLLCARHSSRHREGSRDLQNHRAEGTAVVIPILGDREPGCLVIIGKPCVGGRRHGPSSVRALPCLFLHPSADPESSLLKGSSSRSLPSMVHRRGPVSGSSGRKSEEMGEAGMEGQRADWWGFQRPVVPSATPSAPPPNIACFALPSPRVIWTWCLIEIEDLFSCVPTQSDLKCGQPQSMLWCFTVPGI